jgi:hypothetical protein
VALASFPLSSSRGWRGRRLHPTEPGALSVQFSSGRSHDSTLANHQLVGKGGEGGKERTDCQRFLESESVRQESRGLLRVADSLFFRIATLALGLLLQLSCSERHSKRHGSISEISPYRFMLTKC